jgi:uncharacterized iron-regulated membrane protein
VRRLVVTLHLAAATVAGLVLLLLGLTGSVMAFEPELDHLFHSTLAYVTPQSTVRSLADLGAAVSAALPGQRITGYSLSTSPGLSYQVQTRGGAVYVNQYTGAVLGLRPPGPDLLSTVHQLHLRLSLRDYPALGKAVVTWSAVGLLWLMVSGVYLWWPRLRVGVRRGTTPRRFWLDLHTSLGILSIVVVFTLTVTGLLIGFDGQAVPWLYRVTQTTPVVMNARPPAFHVVPTGTPIGPDEAVSIARAALPGAAPIQVNVPGPTGVYLVAARFPEDLTPGGRSRVYIHPYTREVLLAEGSRTAPMGTRLVTLNRAIHTGDVFGLVGKTVVSAASLFLVLQAVSGLMLWSRGRWPGRRPVGTGRGARLVDVAVEPPR